MRASELPCRQTTPELNRLRRRSRALVRGDRLGVARRRRRLLQALDLEPRDFLRLRLLQDVLAIEARHAVVLGLLLQVVAGAQLLLAGILGDALLVEVGLLALGHGV